jgi:transcriptional regulator with XRE-family HTH domain
MEEKWKKSIKVMEKIYKSKGMTHEEIANLTGKSRPNVTRFFSCNTEPGINFFMEIAEAISIDIELSDRDRKLNLNNL